MVLRVQRACRKNNDLTAIYPKWLFVLGSIKGEANLLKHIYVAQKQKSI
jgi:hypothetical protein